LDLEGEFWDEREKKEEADLEKKASALHFSFPLLSLFLSFFYPFKINKN
jgi:hypothetical protein